MSRLVLDGKKMPEKTFFEKFKEIVGCSFEKWSKKSTTARSSGSEWFEYRSRRFVLGGTCYEPPKLYEIKKKK